MMCNEYAVPAALGDVHLSILQGCIPIFEVAVMQQGAILEMVCEDANGEPVSVALSLPATATSKGSSYSTLHAMRCTLIRAGLQTGPYSFAPSLCICNICKLKAVSECQPVTASLQGHFDMRGGQQAKTARACQSVCFKLKTLPDALLMGRHSLSGIPVPAISSSAGSRKPFTDGAYI